MKEAIFICLLIVHYGKTTNCKVQSRSGVALEGFVIKSYHNPNFHDCYIDCKNNPGCRSINYFIQKTLCQHNSFKISEKPELKRNDIDATYVDNPDAAGKLAQQPKTTSAPKQTTKSDSTQATKSDSTQTTKSDPIQATTSAPTKATKSDSTQTIKSHTQATNSVQPIGTQLSPTKSASTIATTSAPTQTTLQVLHGGWVLIARFSNSDTKNWMRTSGSWWYDVIIAQGNTTSTTANQDMIAPGFWTTKGREIKITRTDDPTHTPLLITTSNCLGDKTFREKMSSYGNFRSGKTWSHNGCLGSCGVIYSGQYLTTDGFKSVNCNKQKHDEIRFWCSDWRRGGAVLTIGGIGRPCGKDVHGLGITEDKPAKFGDEKSCDVGDDANYCQTQNYGLNLWIK